jgi:ABC-2 type transport system ATP-binding protein
VIEVDQLLKYYGAIRAVGPVTASIPQGEVVGLVGLNGAGKTTTLRILAGDLLPTSGSLRVDGLDVVADADSLRQRIGYLPDVPPLYPEMTVQDFLTFVARLRRVTGKQVGSWVQDAMRLTALTERRAQRIGELSHGYRQRVGIAQAIVHRPSLVILDEPISGLDPVQIVEMRQLLRGLRGEHTVVVSSHILSEISETCDRLLVMRDGQVVASGTEPELLAVVTDNVTLTVKLQVQPGAASPVALLEGLSGVKSVESRACAEGLFDLELLASRDLRPEVASCLVAAGHGLLELGRRQRALEELFVELSRPAVSKDGAA